MEVSINGVVLSMRRARGKKALIRNLSNTQCKNLVVNKQTIK